MTDFLIAPVATGNVPNPGTPVIIAQDSFVDAVDPTLAPGIHTMARSANDKQILVT